MIRNQYKITLYNTQFFSDVLTYHFPVLPKVGDLIEVIEESTMFVIRERSFKPLHNRGLICVTLHGVFEKSEEMSQNAFEKLRCRIQDQHEGIIRNREGIIEHREFTGFPDNLD
ncbi:hypothetical protein ABIB62_003277 [Mucilaginibacter sp. UYP25]